MGDKDGDSEERVVVISTMMMMVRRRMMWVRKLMMVRMRREGGSMGDKDSCGEGGDVGGKYGDSEGGDKDDDGSVGGGVGKMEVDVCFCSACVYPMDDALICAVSRCTN